MPDVLHYHRPAVNDLSVTDCVTSPVDFILLFFSASKMLVDRASSGRLTVSRLLGGLSDIISNH